MPPTVRFSDELQTHSRSGLLWTTFKRLPPLRGDQAPVSTHSFGGRGSFRTTGPTSITDTNGPAGDDNFSDTLGTANGGQFWTDPVWGGQQANNAFDTSGKAEFYFRVGIQPGNNYRVIASIGDNSGISGAQSSDPGLSGYIGPALDQFGGKIASEPLTVWRRLWVENDSMLSENAAASHNYTDVLVYNISSPSPGNGLALITTNNIPISSTGAGMRLVFPGVGGEWTVLSTHIEGAIGFIETKGVPVGFQVPAKLYDDDGFGLVGDQLPRLDFVSPQMKDYYKPAFIDVVDADSYNDGKTVTFKANENVNYFSVVDDAEELSDARLLWVCPVTAAFQALYDTDQDPNMEGQGLDNPNSMPLGDTVTTLDQSYGHSTVYTENCRENYDLKFRQYTSSNDMEKLNLYRGYYKSYVEGTIAHEMGHHPARQSNAVDHLEGGIMMDGGGIGLVPSSNGKFTLATLWRFRKVDRWND